MRDNCVVLVLWSDAFDELAATGFATTLRKAGLRVKLVGLSYARATGAGGVALVPEITLEQAMSLSERTSALVLPAGAGALRRVGDDPRLQELLTAVLRQRAVLVTSAEATAQLAHLVEGPATAHNMPYELMSYANKFGVLECAVCLAERLASPGILTDVA